MLRGGYNPIRSAQDALCRLKKEREKLWELSRMARRTLLHTVHNHSIIACPSVASRKPKGSSGNQTNCATPIEIYD